MSRGDFVRFPVQHLRGLEEESWGQETEVAEIAELIVINLPSGTRPRRD